MPAASQSVYLTSSAIGYLTELILATAITFYLAGRLRRTSFRTQTALLVCFFAATTFLILLLLGDVALAPSLRVYADFLENIAVGLCLDFLLQFAYHFPRLDARKKMGSRAHPGRDGRVYALGGPVRLVPLHPVIRRACALPLLERRLLPGGGIPVGAGRLPAPGHLRR